MNIYEPGGHIEAGDIDGFDGEGRINVSGHSNDVMMIDGHIHHTVDVVGWIDDVTAPQQKVIFLLRLRGSAGHRHHCNCEEETLHEQSLSV